MPCGWAVKAGMVLWFVCGWQVKLCDTLVTHGPYLSALVVQHDKALYKSTFTSLYVLTTHVTFVDKEAPTEFWKSSSYRVTPDIDSKS